MQKRVLKIKPGCNTAPDIVKENIKANCQLDLPWLSQEEPHSRPIAIVCGGPSLTDRLLELAVFPGPILACNGAYQFLCRNEIIPSWFMLLDSRLEENSLFITKLHSNTECFLAMQCDPAIVQHLQGCQLDVTLYLTTVPGVFDMVKHIDKPKVAIGGAAGTVGCKAIALAYSQGFRDIHLFGFDSSYGDDKPDQHHAYPQYHDDSKDTIEVFVDGQEFTTTPTLANQAESFVPWAKELAAEGVNIELHCDGLLPALVDYCNKVGEAKSLEEREREKYEEIWKHDQYRKVAPGEQLVDYAFYVMGMLRGHRLTDFGCGTGRAAYLFKMKYGMDVLGVDHATNCLDKNVDIPMMYTSLWDVDHFPKTRWGYCTDVMEHIPVEKVDAVLEKIADACIDGCFFQIALANDNLGAIIGRKLHMTVISAPAWRQTLLKYFNFVDQCSDDGITVIFRCFKAEDPDRANAA